MWVHRADMIQEGQAVHSRHVEVGQEDVKIRLAQSFQGSDTIGGKGHFSPCILDGFSQDSLEHFVVIGHQHPCGHSVYVHIVCQSFQTLPSNIMPRNSSNF